MRLTLAICLAGLMSGCDAVESYQNRVSWNPTAVYDWNLATEAVNPGDLIHGQVSGATDGVAAAGPVDRLRHDTVKSISDANSTASATPTPAAPSPAAGLAGN